MFQRIFLKVWLEFLLLEGTHRWWKARKDVRSLERINRLDVRLFRGRICWFWSRRKKRAFIYIYISISLFLSACVRSEHSLALSVHARARITPRTRWSRNRSINRSIDRMGTYSLARIRSRNVRGTRSPRFHSYVNDFSDIKIVCVCVCIYKKNVCFWWTKYTRERNLFNPLHSGQFLEIDLTYETFYYSNILHVSLRVKEKSLSNVKVYINRCFLMNRNT